MPGPLRLPCTVCYFDVCGNAHVGGLSGLRVVCGWTYLLPDCCALSLCSCSARPLLASVRGLLFRPLRHSRSPDFVLPFSAQLTAHESWLPCGDLLLAPTRRVGRSLRSRPLLLLRTPLLPLWQPRPAVMAWGRVRPPLRLPPCASRCALRLPPLCVRWRPPWSCTCSRGFRPTRGRRRWCPLWWMLALWRRA